MNDMIKKLKWQKLKQREHNNTTTAMHNRLSWLIKRIWMNKLNECYLYVSACVCVNPAVTRIAWDTVCRRPCAGHNLSRDGCQVLHHCEPFALWSGRLPNHCYQVPPRPLCRQNQRSPADRHQRGSCHAAGPSQRREQWTCAEGWQVGSQTKHHRGSTWTASQRRVLWDGAVVSCGSRRLANTASTRWCGPHCSCPFLGSPVTIMTPNYEPLLAAAWLTPPLLALLMHSAQNSTSPRLSLQPPLLLLLLSFPDSHHQCCHLHCHHLILPARHNQNNN